MTILETRNLKKIYGEGETQVCALNGIKAGWKNSGQGICIRHNKGAWIR